MGKQNNRAKRFRVLKVAGHVKRELTAQGDVHEQKRARPFGVEFRADVAVGSYRVTRPQRPLDYRLGLRGVSTWSPVTVGFSIASRNAAA